MKRRRFIGGIGALAGTMVTPLSFAQLSAFGLRVVRQSGWEELMGRNLCIPSKIYTTDPERLVCYGLELPDRQNMQGVSAIPEGSYDAVAALSEKNGPVIELLDVPYRTAVQFHSGNWVGNTQGCVIFGSKPVTSATLPPGNPPSYIKRTKGCWISGSREARDKVLDLYGWTDRQKGPPKRFIQVKVESE